MEALLQQSAKKQQSSLSDQDLKFFKELIIQKIDEATEEIDFLLDSVNEMRDSESADVSSGQHHPADLGSSQAMIQLNYSLIERTRKFIRQLNRALERIENGTYGICKVTGKPIAKERLKAAPHTQHSIEAKLGHKPQPVRR